MRNKGRKAGITIEIALSIALSVIVLFLVIGLFSENLKTMMSRIGLKSFFRASEKTTVADWGDDPTATQINVQIAADYGLSSEHKKAKAAIEDYYNNKSTNGRLNDLKADQRNLAKELTKYAKSGMLGTNPDVILNETRTPDNLLSYYDFAKNNGVKFDWIMGRVYTGDIGVSLKATNTEYSFNTSKDALKWLNELDSIFDYKRIDN